MQNSQTQQSHLYVIATRYATSGLSVLPAIPVEKRPAVRQWMQYQRHPPTESELADLLSSGTSALCVICGAVSGNLEMIDFDLAGEAYPGWQELVEARAPGLLAKLYIESSPSRGLHVAYRCETPVPGNLKLAVRRIEAPSGEEMEYRGKRYKPRRDQDRWFFEVVLIETRGEGGLFLCAPSPGYEQIQGRLTELSVITAKEREVLISSAKSLDERFPDHDPDPTNPKPPHDGGGLRPGDDFNQRGDIRPTLRKHGWKLVRGGENEHWCRPGKDHGTSATLKGGVLYVFSSSASPLEPDRAYSPFAAYTLLEHNGDFAAAAKALAHEGYGSKPTHQVCADDDEQDDDEFPVPLGQRDPVSGRIVLSPKRTIPTAKAYVRLHHTHPDGPTLRYHGAVIWEWRMNKYVPIDDDELSSRIFPWLHEALRYDTKRSTGEHRLVRYESNPSTTKAALDSIKTHAHLPVETPMPCWLDGAPDRPRPDELLCYRNGYLHIPSGTLIPPTPSLWTSSATEFDYVPDAAAPARWLEFLDTTFGGDEGAISLLQEWCGYCLTPDTSQQKTLLIVGAKRSGKGTIGRVLTALIGPSNVVHPTTTGIMMNFGLQPWIGKSLALFSDARFKDLTDPRWAPFIERVLTITGEDPITIDRKYLTQLTVRLQARLMFLTNDMPSFAEVSEPLASRFLVIQTDGSRFGREDPGLTAKLIEELPGISHWAIEGWKRLIERGRFVQPDLREDAEDEDPLDAFQGPARRVAKFVEEQCVVGRGRRVPVGELYQSWCLWAKPQGASDLNTQMFGRYLREVTQGVDRRRGSSGAFYDGIALKSRD